MNLRNSWTIAFLTSTGIFTTFMLRLNISSITQLIQIDLHLTDFQVGLLLSSFLWAYTVLQPLAGWITDRFGARNAMFYGIIAASTITILTGFVSSFIALLGMRIALGIAQSPNFITGAKVSASGWFKQSQHGRASSVWIAGGRIATAITFPFAAWLAIVFPGQFRLYNFPGWNLTWQWVFIVTGTIGVAWCILWFFAYSENPRTLLSASNAQGQVAKYVSFFKSHSKLTFGLSIASFGQGYVAYYLNLWLPFYLVRAQKFTVLNAGIYASIPIIAAVVAIIIVGGFVSDHFTTEGKTGLNVRRRLFTLGMITVAVTMFITAYSALLGSLLQISGAYVALGALTIMGVGWGMSTPSLWAALVEATPKEFTGSMAGYQNFGGNLGGIAVTLLTGLLLASTGSFLATFALGAFVTIVSAFSIELWVRDSTTSMKRIRQIEQSLTVN